MKHISQQYFADKPEARDGVMKAYYAYHVGHFRLDPRAHNFSGGARESTCAWCNRSREMVRHDDLPAHCEERPVIDEIEDVILTEEERANELFDNAAHDIPKLIAKHGLSGESLAVMHHTHGYDPSIVEGFVNIPAGMMDDYHAAMKLEADKSRKAIKREVVMAKT